MAVDAAEVDNLIEEMLNAKAAPEPGTVNAREVLHRGDEELPAAVVVQAMNSAGWVFIYDTITHDRSICNRNMLADTMKKKRPDGTRIFTTVKPKQKPKQGQVKCLLHPDRPERKQYDTMGLPVCTSGHLMNDYELTRHMRNRHKSAYDAIQTAAAQEKENLDMEFKRLLLDQAARGKRV